MVTHGFIIDNRKCIGCHACTVACKAEHDVPIGVNRTWVKYIEKGTFPFTKRSFSVMRCNHCADAPCVDICPVTALFTRPDGIVDFDSRRCIGCKACIQACPYDAIYIDPYEQTAAKCNYCTHRTDVGLAPPCVTVCPTHAIICGDLEDPHSEIGRLASRESVQVRKPEKGTLPKLFYIDGDRASLDPMAASTADTYMWSQGEAIREPEEFPWPSPSSRDSLPNEPRQTRGWLGQLTRRVYDAPRERVVWGWKVSSYILTKAIAAGAFGLPLMIQGSGQSPGAMGWIGAILGLLFLLLTCILLVNDLRRVDRFLYIFLRPQWKSWLVKGGYILLLFGCVLGLWLIGGLIGGTGFQRHLTWPGIILSFLTAVYTAFLFAQAKGRDFWQSPLLSVHMLLHAVLAGGAVLLLFHSVFDDAAAERLRMVLLVSIVLSVLAFFGELYFPHATHDAKSAAQEILRGRGALPFWIGVLVLGHAAPGTLLLWGPGWPDFLSALLMVGGVLIGAHLWVTIPQRIPQG